jgi:hypothetical protein
VIRGTDGIGTSTRVEWSGPQEAAEIPGGKLPGTSLISSRGVAWRGADWRPLVFNRQSFAVFHLHTPKVDAAIGRLKPNEIMS